MLWPAESAIGAIADATSATVFYPRLHLRACCRRADADADADARQHWSDFSACTGQKGQKEGTGVHFGLTDAALCRVGGQVL